MEGIWAERVGILKATAQVFAVPGASQLKVGVFGKPRVIQFLTSVSYTRTKQLSIAYAINSNLPQTHNDNGQIVQLSSEGFLHGL